MNETNIPAIYFASDDVTFDGFKGCGVYKHATDIIFCYGKNYR